MVHHWAEPQVGAVYVDPEPVQLRPLQIADGAYGRDAHELVVASSAAESEFAAEVRDGYVVYFGVFAPRVGHDQLQMAHRHKEACSDEAALQNVRSAVLHRLQAVFDESFAGGYGLEEDAVQVHASWPRPL